MSSEIISTSKLGKNTSNTTNLRPVYLISNLNKIPEKKKVCKLENFTAD